MRYIIFLFALNLMTFALDFNKDVRPILSEKCFSCHGPDEEARKGGKRIKKMLQGKLTRVGSIRFDDIKHALQQDIDGEKLITPFKPEDSLMIYLLNPDDEDDIMPPKKFNKPLTKKEIEILTQWVKEGAKYDKFWIWKAPAKTKPPTAEKNIIDAFIIDKLKTMGLSLNKEADKNTLVRRVYMDLLGFAPSKKEVESFVNDKRDNAYEILVDKLLNSKHYGENMARTWLDLARYADTDGYQEDKVRSIWPWRDWVIKAYNDDMPFDQFTIEQLAGDLLSNPTKQQLIATGYNRNTLINREGGVKPEEYRVKAVVDRVNNLGRVWMGLTLECAQCHDHRYDSITHKDYFALYDIFNQDAEETKQNHKADIKDISPKIKLGNTKASTLVMRQDPKGRTTYLHIRGNYLTQDETEVIKGQMPKAMKPIQGKVNRLSLAKYLMSDDNTLSARVLANRIWAHHFSKGIITTSGNIGSQAPLASHPKLLDYLAVLIKDKYKWKQKNLHRLILLSKTYKQSSKRTQEKINKDATNKYLSSFPRQRLSGENIRDNALKISGLLDTKMYGKPVFPPKPKVVSAQSDHWEHDNTKGQYRRSIYVFWQRTAVYPLFINFDALTRDECVTDRFFTTTPLQAFNVLNGPLFMDAARSLMTRYKKDASWIKNAFFDCTSRYPTHAELSHIKRTYETLVKEYNNNKTNVAQVLKLYTKDKKNKKDSKSPRRKLLDISKLPSAKQKAFIDNAAKTIVMNILLSLDETKSIN